LGISKFLISRKLSVAYVFVGVVETVVILFCFTLLRVLLCFYFRVIPLQKHHFTGIFCVSPLDAVIWIFYISVSHHVTISADEEFYQLKCGDNLTVNILNITVEGSDCRTQQCIVTEDTIRMFKNRCLNTSSCQLDMEMAPRCINDYSHFNLSYTCNCKFVNVGLRYLVELSCKLVWNILARAWQSVSQSNNEKAFSYKILLCVLRKSCH
jgi:hypothetical protein